MQDLSYTYKNVLFDNPLAYESNAIERYEDFIETMHIIESNNGFTVMKEDEQVILKKALSTTEIDDYAGIQIIFEVNCRLLPVANKLILDYSNLDEIKPQEFDKQRGVRFKITASIQKYKKTTREHRGQFIDDIVLLDMPKFTTRLTYIA